MEFELFVIVGKNKACFFINISLPILLTVNQQ
jgi:hypothetical protein